MRVLRAALSIVLLAALVAGCSYFGRRDDNKIATGSVAALPRKKPASPPAAPSLTAFEATDPATGLTCTGSYQPLENSVTFDASVVCDDGRKGRVTGARSQEPNGTGTLTLDDGTGGSVALKRLFSESAEAPPTPETELPSPGPTYVR